MVDGLVCLFFVVFFLLWGMVWYKKICFFMGDGWMEVDALIANDTGVLRGLGWLVGAVGQYDLRWSK